MNEVQRECPYLCFYKSYLKMLEPYNYEERGRLITTMMEYMYYGVVPELEGNERFVWNMLQSQIDRDKEAYITKCETNRRNGQKGGRPKSTACEETEGFSEEPNEPNKKENKTKNKNKNKNKKNTERENIIPPLDTETEESEEAVVPSPYEIPDVDSILAFCRQEGIYVDPYRFIERYDTVGWRLSGHPIYDWRPLVRKWARSEEDTDTNYQSTLSLIEKLKREKQDTH